MLDVLDVLDGGVVATLLGSSASTVSFEPYGVETAVVDDSSTEVSVEDFLPSEHEAAPTTSANDMATMASGRKRRRRTDEFM